MRISRLVFQIASAALLLGPVTEVPGRADGPIYEISVNTVERTANVINYCPRRGTTKLELRGAALTPDAHGDIEVENKNGLIEIETEIHDLIPASAFGSVYLTYVLWAIPPDGRPVSVSEVLLDENSRAKFEVATKLQAFGLVVTAEPYFAVTQPSDVVVLEACARPDKCVVEQARVNYQLLERGQYIANVPASELRSIYTEKIEPLDIAQARNALRIAWWWNAAEFAPDLYAKAQLFLRDATGSLDKSSEAASSAAHAAVQAAEDARTTALIRQEAVASR
jgi:hypothetical protein